MFVYEKNNALNIVFGATTIPVETPDVSIWQEPGEAEGEFYTFARIGDQVITDKPD